jgi:hypothetical protein
LGCAGLKSQWKTIKTTAFYNIILIISKNTGLGNGLILFSSQVCRQKPSFIHMNSSFFFSVTAAIIKFVDNFSFILDE